MPLTNAGVLFAARAARCDAVMGGYYSRAVGRVVVECDVDMQAYSDGMGIFPVGGGRATAVRNSSEPVAEADDVPVQGGCAFGHAGRLR